jgi:hypothetical protein
MSIRSANRCRSLHPCNLKWRRGLSLRQVKTAALLAAVEAGVHLGSV